MLLPSLGFGLGLRPSHYGEILETLPKSVDWFEIISEDYLGDGGRYLHYLDRVREHYPIVMHGVSLSIGSADPLNQDYLRRLKALMERVEAPWVSDHFCWTGVAGFNTHDLLPLPFTEEAIAHIVARVQHVQDFLGRPLLLENVSSYVHYQHSTIPEWEFNREVAERSGCRLLLDVNNVYVNAQNHGFDPKTFILETELRHVTTVSYCWSYAFGACHCRHARSRYYRRSLGTLRFGRASFW